MTVSSTNFTRPDDDPPKATEIYIFSGKQVGWVGVQNTIKQQQQFLTKLFANEDQVRRERF
jgi:hypothetical protein